VEFAKAKHEEGLSLEESALTSARLRFRPILMTAFAFILGVVPLILASGAGAGPERDGTGVFWACWSLRRWACSSFPQLYIRRRTRPASYDQGSAVRNASAPSTKGGHEMARLLFLLLLVVGLVTTGCTVGPNYQRPETSLPEAYRGVDPGGATTPAHGSTFAELAWWELFKDPDLQD